jgi:hypothetical protein
VPIQFVVPLCRFVHQELRPKKRDKTLTIDEIDTLVKKEHLRVKGRSEQPGNTEAGHKSEAAGSMITASGEQETPSKGKRTVRDNKPTASVIEIIDDIGARSGLCEINFEYIMWGMSQKPQLAGVEA